MKSLIIEFINSKQYPRKELSSWGQITIGDFTERFVIPLEYWSKEDYEKQWKEGLERIKYNNTSGIVTYIEDFSHRALVIWWLLYKEGNKIFIQNELLMGKEFEKKLKTMPFNHNTCYSFITPRIVATNWEDRVSEWSIEI